MKWVFPKNLEDLETIMEHGKVTFHGGGTMLLRGGVPSKGVWADLTGVKPLGEIVVTEDKVTLGGGVTYAKAVEALGAHKSRHILVQSLGAAAATPLRNRITLGGSLMARPYWSDTLGPLTALGSQVCLEGSRGGTYPMATFLEDSSLRGGANLLREVTFENIAWDGWYHRETRTGFDYPAFTLTILYRRENHEIRGVFTGTSRGVECLSHMEELFQGTEPSKWRIPKGSELFSSTFPDRPHGSGDYLCTLAEVALERGLSFFQRGDHL